MSKKELKEIENNINLVKQDEILKSLERNGVSIDYTINKLKELMECDTKDIALRATIKALELYQAKSNNKVKVSNLNLLYLEKMEKEENSE